MLRFVQDEKQVKHLIPLIIELLLLVAGLLRAQTGEYPSSIPVTVSIFSESVSLPDFKGFFRSPNWGLRVGTELYYGRHDRRQWLQTINLGYYRHRGWQQGLYLSSEFGYRRALGDLSADFTVGAGYLHLVSELPRYEPDGTGYRKAGRRMHKLMPTLGLGLGYQFDRFTVFSRYEIFGEIPFRYKGVPVLPHKALHLGTRFQAFN